LLRHLGAGSIVKKDEWLSVFQSRKSGANGLNGKSTDCLSCRSFTEPKIHELPLEIQKDNVYCQRCQ
jgi:hypothetical protein